MTKRDASPILSIVIVTYESKNEIRACLDSVKQFAPKDPYEVFVVDNASRDGTADFVRNKYPWVKLIRNTGNEGFGRANNRAIQQATGEFILALNPDTQVTAGALDHLILIARNAPKLGTLGARLVYPDGKEQPSSYMFPGIWSELRKIFFTEKIDEAAARAQTITRVQWSVGAALLFPREIKQEVTLFDPNIFLYSEDMELCWRLLRQGRKNYVTNTATIVHAWNKSAEQYYGERVSERRLRAYRDTTRYVLAKHQRGPLKVLRFTTYRKLVAINSRIHIMLLRVRARHYEAKDLANRIAEHHAKIRVFGHGA